MSNLERRLKKLEDAAAKAAQSERHGIELQLGYVQRLPADYAGERHVVTVSRLPDGKHEWEERPGAGPVDDGSDCGTIIRLVLVKAKAVEAEDKRPAADLSEPKADVPAPDNGDPLARVRAILAAPPVPPPQTQPQPWRGPSPPTPRWSWAN